MIEKIKIEHHKYKLEWYRGSLDFPCDFCGSNSYRNYHITKDESLEFVVCEDCLKKVKEEKN